MDRCVLACVEIGEGSCVLVCVGEDSRYVVWVGGECEGSQFIINYTFDDDKFIISSN